jgi:threonyl-tRNA synthetase
MKLDHLRHSLAHVLALAARRLYPGVKFGIGPVTETGFFYDFDFGGNPPGENDLARLEEEMKKIIKEDLAFEPREVSADEARAKFKDQPFKLELIGDLEEYGTTDFQEISKLQTTNYKLQTPPQITLYSIGEFTDLCRGGHVERTSDIPEDAFALTHLAGAYWRGSEKNPQLTRIYGAAFASKKELDAHLSMLEEAKKRDHKKLGPELGLFMFHETSPGMPYWLPRGLTVYNELVNFWRKEHARLGYEEIASPLINKAELWQTSGHWEFYKDDMFIADMGENEIYGVKPMNCPNAMVVFKSRQVSYKDLPLRLSDTDRLHRYERSGTLNGLFRVRSFQQDDSHNFITEEMIESEYKEILKIADRFYTVFGLSYSLRLGTRPSEFLGDPATWDKAEEALKRILDNSGKEFTVLERDGAFYGPKVDILMKDVLGREWQMGTIQLDFQLPQRFNLSYTAADGNKKTPVVIHRVIYGSLERFIGILIEHFGGAFPFWLAPVQVVVLPVSDKHAGYGKTVADVLRTAGIRIELPEASETLNKRIREAEMQKVPYILVVGDKEKDAGTVTVRRRSSTEQKAEKVEEFLIRITKEINEKTLP